MDKINLSNITLISIYGRDDETDFVNHLESLIYSQHKIQFGSVKILSPYFSEKTPKNIQYIKIPAIKSINEYSNFMVKKLYDYVDTDFVITIQNDGFIINPHLWKNEFLEYDYIGAPWRNIPHYSGVRVGNGGFSLRSKKFLSICKNYMPNVNFNEDHLICITFRNLFLSHDIKYAPIDIAQYFSVETKTEYNNDISKSFGIHNYNSTYKTIKESDEFKNVLKLYFIDV